MDEAGADYPARLTIDYPDKFDRLTTFFRLVVAIPILIIAWLMTGPVYHWPWRFWAGPVIGGGYVFLPTLLMILFRKKYPRWWFDWNLALTKFGLRVSSYVLLLAQTYPSTDEEQSVHLEIEYPDVEAQLGRGMPLVKWLLVIPHLVVLAFLSIVVVFCTVVAWFAILFTEKYPRSFFSLVVGVLRWSIRVDAYAVLLVTDKYPPFEL